MFREVRLIPAAHWIRLLRSREQPADVASPSPVRLVRVSFPAPIPCCFPSQDLGKGTFGSVKRALWKTAPVPGSTTGETAERDVAVKVLVKKHLKGKEADIWSEMEVLQGLDHPNVVRPLLPRTAFFLVGSARGN